MNDPTGGYVGPKQPASGRNAVCSSQSPIVTETMLNTMKAGGNAVDAAIAGCMVQATVPAGHDQPHRHRHFPHV